MATNEVGALWLLAVLKMLDHGGGHAADAAKAMPAPAAAQVRAAPLASTSRPPCVVRLQPAARHQDRRPGTAAAVGTPLPVLARREEPAGTSLPNPD